LCTRRSSLSTSLSLQHSLHLSLSHYCNEFAEASHVQHNFSERLADDETRYMNAPHSSLSPSLTPLPLLTASFPSPFAAKWRKLCVCLYHFVVLQVFFCCSFKAPYLKHLFVVSKVGKKNKKMGMRWGVYSLWSALNRELLLMALELNALNVNLYIM